MASDFKCNRFYAALLHSGCWIILVSVGVGWECQASSMELIHKGRACPSLFPSYTCLHCYDWCYRSQRKALVDLGIESTSNDSGILYRKFHRDAQLWIADIQTSFIWKKYSFD